MLTSSSAPHAVDLLAHPAGFARTPRAVRRVASQSTAAKLFSSPYLVPRFVGGCEREEVRRPPATSPSPPRARRHRRPRALRRGLDAPAPPRGEARGATLRTAASALRRRRPTRRLRWQPPASDGGGSTSRSHSRRAGFARPSPPRGRRRDRGPRHRPAPSAANERRRAAAAAASRPVVPPSVLLDSVGAETGARLTGLGDHRSRDRCHRSRDR